MTHVASNILGRLAHMLEGAVLKSADVSINEAPERSYGYLVVMLRHSGQLILVQAIGDVPADKIKACHKVAMEKARTLLANPGHISTWQSRDPANKKYGGGISTDHLIIAFSGLKEYADEVVCLMAARQLSFISDPEVEAILAISDQTDHPVTTREFMAAMNSF